MEKSTDKNTDILKSDNSKITVDKLKGILMSERQPLIRKFRREKEVNVHAESHFKIVG